MSFSHIFVRIRDPDFRDSWARGVPRWVSHTINVHQGPSIQRRFSLSSFSLFLTWMPSPPSQKSPKPAIVAGFLCTQILAKRVVCGSHHNAVIADDGELYTWGSNANGCLGRSLDDDGVSAALASGAGIGYTALPGHCGGFGSIVDRIGRGLVRSVSCGRHFTVVATHPYQGPAEQAAKKLMEDRGRSEAEWAREEDAAAHARDRDAREAAEANRQREQILFLTSRRLCSLDPNCPGEAGLHPITILVLLA